MNKFVLSLFGILFFGIAIISAFIFFGSAQEIPAGKPGREAENLRNEIELSLNVKDWKDLAAYEFTLELNQNTHFRDQGRGLTEVIFRQKNDEYRVQYSEKDYALAYLNGEALTGKDLNQAYRTAKSYHDTDLFWLNPFMFLRDRTEIQFVGSRALLVKFLSRDNDTYLIVTDENKKPTHWKMWTKQIPISGMESSFENWLQPEGTKAWISLKHHNKFQEIIFTNLKTYSVYPPENSEDRFINFNQLSTRISED